MGLDNGICVKRTPVTEKIPEMALFEDDFIRKYKYDYEPCYWRKCYNVRDKILAILDDGDYYRLELSANDVERIAEMLKSFTADNWEDGSGSIWEFDEIRDTLENQIRNLEILRRLMQEHELEVYFYDSY